MLWLAMLGAEPDLDAICRRAVEQVIAASPKVKQEDVGIAVILMEKGSPARQTGGFRAEEAMYPASVVKAFYLAYCAHLRSEGRLSMSEEDLRAARDMIKDSSNDATGHILDIATGTTGGPELPPRLLKQWMDKRQAVNKWLESMGYSGVNACQKTWNEGPYGREKQGYGPGMELRNSATPAACARLMADIAQGRLADGPNTEWMLSELERSLAKMDGQTRTFIGGVLPKNLRHYSKAGFAYQVRHDLALVRWPDGKDVVLCVFTDRHGSDRTLVPSLARSVLVQIGLL